MRVLTEERILGAVDHPFLARLYGTIQTDTHLHFLMQVRTDLWLPHPTRRRGVLYSPAHVARSLSYRG